MDEKQRRGKKPPDKKKKTQITFKVGMEGNPDQRIVINAYLFNGQGKLVATAPLISGAINFEVENNQPDNSGKRVFGYRLVLHIDNRICFGNVLPVTVVAGNMDLKCGFLEYGPGAMATISFQAGHPGDFASFDFDLVRVSTQLPSASANGLVGANTVNGFDRVGITFTKSIKVDTLFNERLPVGETACTRAAFAEHLWVRALATNGYGRLHYLDAPRAEDPEQIRLRGFALTAREHSEEGTP